MQPEPEEAREDRGVGVAVIRRRNRNQDDRHLVVGKPGDPIGDQRLDLGNEIADRHVGEVADEHRGR